MPTYEYNCEECGIIFERFQHFSEEPVRTCPECGGKVRRVIQPVGIIFKGKGFYVTDNRSSTSSTATPGEKKGVDRDGAAKDKAESDSSASSPDSDSTSHDD